MHAGALGVVHRAGLRGAQQREGVVECARFVFGLRRRQRPLGTARALGCERGGALEKRCRGG